MSPRRRSHGRHGGAGGGAVGSPAGTEGPVAPGAPVAPRARVAPRTQAGPSAQAPQDAPGGAVSLDEAGVVSPSGGQVNGGQANGGRPNGGRPLPPRRDQRLRPGPRFQPKAPPTEGAEGAEPAGEPRHACTLAQMRRFIKSRPYVPVHELRRRFEIEGCEDEVTPVATSKGVIFVGLPPQEAQFLGDLIKAGEVGCEMLLDPDSPGVVGVYAMRPVARQ